MPKAGTRLPAKWRSLERGGALIAMMLASVVSSTAARADEPAVTLTLYPIDTRYDSVLAWSEERPVLPVAFSEPRASAWAELLPAYMGPIRDRMVLNPDVVLLASGYVDVGYTDSLKPVDRELAEGRALHACSGLRATEALCGRIENAAAPSPNLPRWSGIERDRYAQLLAQDSATRRMAQPESRRAEFTASYVGPTRRAYAFADSLSWSSDTTWLRDLDTLLRANSDVIVSVLVTVPAEPLRGQALAIRLRDRLRARLSEDVRRQVHAAHVRIGEPEIMLLPTAAPLIWLPERLPERAAMYPDAMPLIGAIATTSEPRADAGPQSMRIDVRDDADSLIARMYSGPAYAATWRWDARTTTSEIADPSRRYHFTMTVRDTFDSVTTTHTPDFRVPYARVVYQKRRVLTQYPTSELDDTTHAFDGRIEELAERIIALARDPRVQITLTFSSHVDALTLSFGFDKLASDRESRIESSLWTYLDAALGWPDASIPWAWLAAHHIKLATRDAADSEPYVLHAAGSRTMVTEQIAEPDSPEWHCMSRRVEAELRYTIAGP